jgi:hypothetical protein
MDFYLCGPVIKPFLAAAIHADPLPLTIEPITATAETSHEEDKLSLSLTHLWLHELASSLCYCYF